MFVTKTAETASRLWILLWLGTGATSLLVARSLLAWELCRRRASGGFTSNVAVIGDGLEAASFLAQFARAGDPSTRLVGVFSPDRHPEGSGPAVPVEGTLADLLRLSRRIRIDKIVIALPWSARAELRHCARRFRDFPVEICLWPEPPDPELTCRRVSYLNGIPLLHLYDKPMSGWQAFVKALEDRILALVILVMCAPLMLLIALAIRLDSAGPVIFRQKRYGFNNEVIEVLKFRSMRFDPAADDPGKLVQVKRDDPRVSRVGRLLRRTSLDELPQLFNVLVGQMSIVGPRPHAVVHNEHYAALIDSYVARHRVKPGITGWAQVNGLRGPTDTLDKMEARIRYDLHYIENWSLAFDLKIIGKTILVGLVHANAY